jgi:hypothetical protein
MSQVKNVRWSAVLEDADMGEMNFADYNGDPDTEPEVITYPTKLEACKHAFYEGCEFNFLGCSCRKCESQQGEHVCIVDEKFPISEDLSEPAKSDAEAIRLIQYVTLLDKTNKLTLPILEELLEHSGKNHTLNFEIQQHNE